MNTQAFRGTQSQGGFTLGDDYGLDYFQSQQLQGSQIPNSYAEFPALGQFSQVFLSRLGSAPHPAVDGLDCTCAQDVAPGWEGPASHPPKTVGPCCSTLPIAPLYELVVS